MIKPELNVFQRIVIVQVLSTWRGTIDKLKPISTAVDAIELTDEEKKIVNYKVTEQRIVWDRKKEEEVGSKVIELEDDVFISMHEYLRSYNRWEPDSELLELFDILDKVRWKLG